MAEAAEAGHHNEAVYDFQARLNRHFVKLWKELKRRLCQSSPLQGDNPLEQKLQLNSRPATQHPDSQPAPQRKKRSLETPRARHRQTMQSKLRPNPPSGHPHTRPRQGITNKPLRGGPYAVKQRSQHKQRHPNPRPLVGRLKPQQRLTPGAQQPEAGPDTGRDELTLKTSEALQRLLRIPEPCAQRTDKHRYLPAYHSRSTPPVGCWNQRLTVPL
ncbi:Hypothetical predicted protein [Pelobates cultripes]|uniref:Uncharacterized protein n=1 Tax=Pelobates cultripes TaxID=61616 RepID=A0AAD1RWD1_PELCU|nr:Hypothetical predicted protein [Pelobates cultripes]